jgi:hypothetical protein
MTLRLLGEITQKEWLDMVRRTMAMDSAVAAELASAMGRPDFAEESVQNHALSREQVAEVVGMLGTQDVRMLKACITNAEMLHRHTMAPAQYAAAFASSVPVCRERLIPTVKTLVKSVRDLTRNRRAVEAGEMARARASARERAVHAAAAGLGASTSTSTSTRLGTGTGTDAGTGGSASASASKYKSKSKPHPPSHCGAGSDADVNADFNFDHRVEVAAGTLGAHARQPRRVQA